MPKEAKARILINDLLRRSGWRFFDDEAGPANVALEAHVKLKKKTLEETPKGGIRPHNRFSIKANRSEVLFVDYMAEHLNPGGRASSCPKASSSRARTHTSACV